MKIRSITFFINPLSQDFNSYIQKLGHFAQNLKKSFESSGIEVQTLRLSTQPFPLILEELGNKENLDWIINLENSAKTYEFDYLSVGPALISHPFSYELIPQILMNTRNVFTSAFIADQSHGISLFALSECSKIIVQSAAFEPGGFANLRFSALANVNPLGPFFPGSFHNSAKPNGFSIAVEAADEVINVFSNATSLLQARDLLLQNLENHAQKIEQILVKYSTAIDLEFFGFDFSVAPFPVDSCSLGNAMEILGISALGNHGSLAAAAFLADTLDRGKWKRVGFNGLMLPLLEDSRLAKRSIDQTLKVKDLLMYSAVCGTGLDTIPISGDIQAEAIYALLMDIAALSARLRKPLTARLMPIPGKKAGDLTDFNFEFFKNGRILEVEASSLSNLLINKNEEIDLQPRKI